MHFYFPFAFLVFGILCFSMESPIAGGVSIIVGVIAFVKAIKIQEYSDKIEDWVRSLEKQNGNIIERFVEGARIPKIANEIEQEQGIPSILVTKFFMHSFCPNLDALIQKIPFEESLSEDSMMALDSLNMLSLSYAEVGLDFESEIMALDPMSNILYSSEKVGWTIYNESESSSYNGFVFLTTGALMFIPVNVDFNYLMKNTSFEKLFSKGVGQIPLLNIGYFGYQVVQMLQNDAVEHDLINDEKKKELIQSSKEEGSLFIPLTEIRKIDFGKTASRLFSPKIKVYWDKESYCTIMGNTDHHEIFVDLSEQLPVACSINNNPMIILNLDNQNELYSFQHALKEEE